MNKLSIVSQSWTELLTTRILDWARMGQEVFGFLRDSIEVKKVLISSSTAYYIAVIYFF